MRNLLLTLMVFALAAPDALAADRNGSRRRNTPRPAAATPQQPAKPAQQAADIKKLCKENPFKTLPKPKEPSEPADLDPTQEIADTRLPELKFKGQCEVSAGRRATHCDEALGLAYLSYYRGKRAFDGELKAVCDSLETEIEKCKNSQSQAIECAQNLYRGVGEKFTAVKKKLDEDVAKLSHLNAGHVKAAETIRGPQQRPGATAAATTRIQPNKWQAATSLITEEAKAGGTAASRVNQTTHNSGCVASVGDKEFCSHITAASDSKFYATTINAVAENTGKVATQMASMANPNGPGGPGSDVTGDNKKNGGLLDSVGGLDGLMKMATLGMMGAGMYCQMSGSCGNQPQQSALTQQPASNAGLGATAPTPASTNPGPETSKLNEAENSKGGGSATPGAEFKTATETSPGGDPSFAGGSGFSSEHGDPEALNNFKGDLGRGPASSTAPGGGGPGGGGGGGDSSGASQPPGDHGLAEAKSLDGSGQIGGGGGLPSHGGFSLSASPDAPAADAALKNILNGDTPPGDAGLASLGDPAAGGNLGGTEDISLQDSESLFFRVKDTHVRCVKRGCVGREVGEKI